LQALDAAYQNFFRRVKQGGKPGFPRFKSKKNKHRSYKSKKVRENIAVLDKRIKLPKLGLVKGRVSKQMEGRILSATISQKPSGKYFVSVCCTDVARKPLEPTGAVAGIDLGLHDFAVTSDGVTIIRQESRWQDSMRKP
jgi:putative transposase